MPRNKRESFIYSVIMCFTMVLWMSMYNVTLHICLLYTSDAADEL